MRVTIALTDFVDSASSSGLSSAIGIWAERPAIMGDVETKSCHKFDVFAVFRSWMENATGD